MTQDRVEDTTILFFKCCKCQWEAQADTCGICIDFCASNSHSIMD